jgi:hypothetical protein
MRWLVEFLIHLSWLIERYAYTFQSYAFLSRLKDQMQPPPPSARAPRYQVSLLFDLMTSSYHLI